MAGSPAAPWVPKGPALAPALALSIAAALGIGGSGCSSVPERPSSEAAGAPRSLERGEDGLSDAGENGLAGAGAAGAGETGGLDGGGGSNGTASGEDAAAAAAAAADAAAPPVSLPEVPFEEDGLGPDLVVPEIIPGRDGQATLYYHIRHQEGAALIPVISHWKSQAGRIQDFPHMNMLIITDAEANIRAIAQVLEQIDRIPPQVEIEAKVIEITHTSGLEYGFELRVDRTPASNSALRGFDGTFHGNSFLESLQSPVPFQGTSFTWASVGRVSEELGDFDYIIRALEQEGYAEILSSPRVVVHDGERAELNAIVEQPIQVTNINFNVTTITTTFKPVGVKLVVQPRTIGTEAITLDITAEVSSLAGEVLVGGPGAALPVPLVATRNTHTVLDVRDGETLVMGGLLEKRIRSDQRGVPVLMNIPLIGRFFGSRDESESRSEVIFVVRITILDESRKARARLRIPEGR